MDNIKNFFILGGIIKMSKDICKGYKDGDYFCLECIKDCKYMTGCCDCYEQTRDIFKEYRDMKIEQDRLKKNRNERFN